MITFRPYTDDDLRRILEVRVGHSVIPESVLTVIAKKVSSSSGDARKALDVAARAVAECLDRTPDNVTTTGPLVKIQDVMKVLKSFEKDYKAIIDGLPTAAKVVLCVASVFAKKNQTVTLRRLHDLVSEALAETSRANDLMQSDDFVVTVEILVDSGLLKSSVSKKRASVDEKVSSQIELHIPVEDVEAALTEELKIPFYATLRDRAASKVN